MPGVVADYTAAEKTLEREARNEDVNVDARQWLRENYEGMTSHRLPEWNKPPRERLQDAIRITQHEIRDYGDEVRQREQQSLRIDNEPKLRVHL